MCCIICYDFTLSLVNADIYFDNTLLQLEGATNGLQLGRKVYSLLKWHDRENGLTLNLRTDSQDAWLFQSPVDSAVVDLSNFNMGIPRCDNRLAYILHSNNYTLLNTVFAIHAIEKQSAPRIGTLYSMKDAAQGEIMNVLLSDIYAL